LHHFASGYLVKATCAALTVVRAWYTNGKPQADVPALGSFDE